MERLFLVVSQPHCPSLGSWDHIDLQVSWISGSRRIRCIWYSLDAHWSYACKLKKGEIYFSRNNHDLYIYIIHTVIQSWTVQLNCFSQRPLGLEYITSTKKTITEPPPPKKNGLIYINLSFISTCNCTHMCCWDDPAWRSFVCRYAIWCSLQTKHRRAIYL